MDGGVADKTEETGRGSTEDKQKSQEWGNQERGMTISEEKQSSKEKRNCEDKQRREGADHHGKAVINEETAVADDRKDMTFIKIGKKLHKPTGVGCTRPLLHISDETCPEVSDFLHMFWKSSASSQPHQVTSCSFSCCKQLQTDYIVCRANAVVGIGHSRSRGRLET